MDFPAAESIAAGILGLPEGGLKMSIDRIKRVNEMIRRELGLALFRTGQGEDADVGKISFVDVTVTRDLREASVQVSIMGTDAEAEVLMKWLRRHRVDFQAHIAKSIALKYTPKLYFKQTKSIEKGDNVLKLLSEIVIPEDPTDPTEAAQGESLNGQDNEEK